MAETASNVISLRPTAPKAVESSESTPAPQMAVLRQGAQGPLVTSMQQYLASWGFSPGKIDGIFGAKTAEAVQALQRKLGVPNTGAMDAQTVEKVKADLVSVASKLKENSANLALRLVEEVKAPAQPSKVAQVATGDSSSVGKWLFFGALGLGAIYLLTRTSSSSSSASDADGVEEILAALEGPVGDVSAPRSKGKSTPPRDPNTGRFLKSGAVTPDEMLESKSSDETQA